MGLSYFKDFIPAWEGREKDGSMKDGGWIPLDKKLASFLPLNRTYTELEAMFSLTKDIDDGEEKAIREYARIWMWSRQKVCDFMEKLRATNKPIESQKKANRKPPFRLINSGLQEEESQKKANRKPIESQKKATTIDPNPSKHKNISSEALRLSEMLSKKILENNPKHKNILESEIERWAGDIDKLNRIDGKEWNDIETALLWSQSNHFWKSNILSGSKFREKWDMLTAQMARQQSNQITTPPVFVKPAYGTPEYKAWTEEQCRRSL